MKTTNNTLQCAIVIPVYNESTSVEQTISKLKLEIAKIKYCSFEIICVNDGSTDNSGGILAQIDSITVLTHDINRGYGAALKSGIDYCNKEWILIIDADGTYALHQIRDLLNEITEETDMIVGARKGIGIVKNPLRRLARWILRKLVHGLTGTMVPDLNSGMRLFRKSVYLDFRHLLPMKFSFTTTITVASLHSGFNIKYVPVEYYQRIGKSNIRPVSDFFGFTITIIRLVSYFDPLRFFLPLSFFIFVIGFLRAIRDVIVTNGIGSLSVILTTLALQIFIAGVIVDVVVRRSSMERISQSMKKNYFKNTILTTEKEVISENENNFIEDHKTLSENT